MAKFKLKERFWTTKGGGKGVYLYERAGKTSVCRRIVVLSTNPYLASRKMKKPIGGKRHMKCARRPRRGVNPFHFDPEETSVSGWGSTWGPGLGHRRSR